jgi:hypothetical protein
MGVGIYFSTPFLYLSGIIKINLGGFSMTENNDTTPQTTKSVPTLGYNNDGVMGSTTTNDGLQNAPSNNKPVDLPPNKVAIFSNRNVYADGYGKIQIGYNIVGNRHAEFWLQQQGIRLATPQELMEAFA